MMSWIRKDDKGYKMLFKTNLDLHTAERMPEGFIRVPVVGELIRSAMEWPQGDIEFANAPSMKSPPFQLELEVVRVTHVQDGIEIELHLPKGRWQSLSDFYKNCYEKVTKSWFI